MVSGVVYKCVVFIHTDLYWCQAYQGACDGVSKILLHYRPIHSHLLILTVVVALSIVTEWNISSAYIGLLFTFQESIHEDIPLVLSGSIGRLPLEISLQFFFFFFRQLVF